MLSSKLPGSSKDRHEYHFTVYGIINSHPTVRVKTAAMHTKALPGEHEIQTATYDSSLVSGNQQPPTAPGSPPRGAME